MALTGLGLAGSGQGIGERAGGMNGSRHAHAPQQRSLAGTYQHEPCACNPPFNLPSFLPQFPEERHRVVYKRPTDLKLKEDVPVCCNLLVANIFDEGGAAVGGLPAAAADSC